MNLFVRITFMSCVTTASSWESGIESLPVATSTVEMDFAMKLCTSYRDRSNILVTVGLSLFSDRVSRYRQEFMHMIARPSINNNIKNR